MIRLRQWFERSVLGQQYFSRSRSDQRIIAIVSLLLAVSLLWFLLWKPVSDWHEDATTRMAQAQSTLDYVKSNEAAARKAGSGKSDDASLIPLVTRAANAQDVTIGRLQPGRAAY
ncbi:MAG: type II secretion system protein GspM [Pseudomonadales bacterium]